MGRRIGRSGEERETARGQGRGVGKEGGGRERGREGVVDGDVGALDLIKGTRVCSSKIRP